jgi:hypothetical protein
MVSLAVTLLGSCHCIRVIELWTIEDCRVIDGATSPFSCPPNPSIRKGLVVGGSSSLTHIHVETIRTNFIRSVVFQTGLASTMVYNSGKILRGDIFPLSINHFLDSSSNDLSPSTEFPKRTYRYVHTCM